MTATTTEQRTQWQLTGHGYEFCNCNPGCTCNFSGFPSSPDGSCQALVANEVTSGRCGDIDLSGLKIVSLIKWPKAIHDGGGQAVLVVEPECSDEQLGAVACCPTASSGAKVTAVLASSKQAPRASRCRSRTPTGSTTTSAGATRPRRYRATAG